MTGNDVSGVLCQSVLQSLRRFVVDCEDGKDFDEERPWNLPNISLKADDPVIIQLGSENVLVADKDPETRCLGKSLDDSFFSFTTLTSTTPPFANTKTQQAQLTTNLTQYENNTYNSLIQLFLRQFTSNLNNTNMISWMTVGSFERLYPSRPRQALSPGIITA